MQGKAEAQRLALPIFYKGVKADTSRKTRGMIDMMRLGMIWRFLGNSVHNDIAERWGNLHIWSLGKFEGNLYKSFGEQHRDGIKEVRIPEVYIWNSNEWNEM